MYHQSTIYIKEELLSRIMEAVRILDIKRSRLLEALLIRYMDDNRAGEKVWEMQKYQSIEKGTRCGSICVFWRRDVYERSCDVRKSFKMSVSFVIAEAIELYLEELIEDMLNCEKEGRTYNYNTFYSIHSKYYENSYLSIIIWNDPGPEVINKALILSD